MPTTGHCASLSSVNSTKRIEDAMARVALAAELGKGFGRPVFVDNLPGAGGTTGTLQVVRAPKDGSTLGLVASGHVINPFTAPRMGYPASWLQSQSAQLSERSRVNKPRRLLQCQTVAARSRHGLLRHGYCSATCRGCPMTMSMRKLAS